MKIRLLTTTFVAMTLSLAGQDEPENRDAKLALAREIIELTQVEKNMEGITIQLKEMAIASLPKDNLTPEQKARIKEIQGKVVEMSMEAAKDIIAKMDAVYAEVYTMQEMQAMKAFFSSPEGRSMLAKQPLVMEKSVPLIQGMQKDLMPKIEQMVKDLQP